MTEAKRQPWQIVGPIDRDNDGDYCIWIDRRLKSGRLDKLALSDNDVRRLAVEFVKAAIRL